MFRHVTALIAPLALALLAVSLPAEETKDVKIKDITLALPADWAADKPGTMQLAKFKIDPVEGDKDAAELTVSSFMGDGGGVDPNLKRWIGQFEAEGREMKLTAGESKQGKYYFAELTGTYLKPDGPPIQRKTKPTPGYRMLGVILLAPKKDVHFLKLTGPEKTVEAATKDFRTAFGGDAEKEEEYEVK